MQFSGINTTKLGWMLLAACLLAVIPVLSIQAEERNRTSDAMYDPNLHLFADTIDIERTWDVSRVLGKPQNLPEPLMVPDKPWELGKDLYILDYASTGSVIYDPQYKKFRMWYGVLYQGADMATKGIPPLVCYAESQDGLHWVKPTLGILDYNGSKENNIVFSDQGTGLTNYMFSVLRDEADPDRARRYKGLGAAWPFGYFVVTSPDGLHWTKQPKLVNTVGGDTFGWAWDPARKTFMQIGRDMVTEKDAALLRGDPVTKGGKRVAGVFESKDVEKWRYQGRALDLDEEDGGGLNFQHWVLNPFNYGNQYLGLLYVASMRGTAQIGWMELVSSRDARAWRYVSRKEAFLAQGTENHWDSNSMLNLAGSPPIPVGNEIYIYFTSRATHGFLGMAKLTRDRLAGMRAGDGQPALKLASYQNTGSSIESVWDGRHIPYVLTKTVRVTGPKLQVNLQTETGGALRVSVHRAYKDKGDTGGQAIPGFSSVESIPLQGDGTRMEMHWKEKKDLSELVGKDVVLMFEFKNATLWSYRFANESQSATAAGN